MWNNFNLAKEEKAVLEVADGSNFIPSSIFRAYDIRGIVDKELTSDVIFTIGLALGHRVLQNSDNQCIIGRDGRLSSPALFEALKEGVLLSGCDVIDIGEVPTPLLYFASQYLAISHA